MSTAPLLAFKAGRSFRREGTNFIDANPTKGAISLYYEDGLLHFKWQNRETGVVEDVRFRLQISALCISTDTAL